MSSAPTLLGVKRLRDARRGPHLRLHLHRHGGIEHAHYHIHRMRADHGAAAAHQQHSHAPLWIGILHGVAGTAAVMGLLPAVIIDQLGHYLMYVLTFGLGSSLAMATFCAGIGLLTVRLRYARDGSHRGWAALAGSASLALGFVWVGGTVLA